MENPRRRRKEEKKKETSSIADCLSHRFLFRAAGRARFSSLLHPQHDKFSRGHAAAHYVVCASVSVNPSGFIFMFRKKYLSPATLLLRKDEIKKSSTSVRERCLFKQKTKHSLCDMNGNLGITVIPQFPLYIPVDTDNKIALPLPFETFIPKFPFAFFFCEKKKKSNLLDG